MKYRVSVIFEIEGNTFTEVAKQIDFIYDMVDGAANAARKTEDESATAG